MSVLKVFIIVPPSFRHSKQKMALALIDTIGENVLLGSRGRTVQHTVDIHTISVVGIQSLRFMI